MIPKDRNVRSMIRAVGKGMLEAMMLIFVGLFGVGRDVGNIENGTSVEACLER